MTTVLDTSVITEVQAEAARAAGIHRPMHSYHEGFAVLKEEVDELWDEIKLKNPSREAIRKEALQVAAMAVRFVNDLCREPKQTDPKEYGQ